MPLPSLRAGAGPGPHRPALSGHSNGRPADVHETPPQAVRPWDGPAGHDTTRWRQMLAMLPRLRDQGHNIVLVEQNATLTSVATVMSGGSTLASDPNEV